jgi:GT2 family glycosyltransferase
MKSVIVVIPCMDVNAYVLECLRGCMDLDYADHRIVLLPDLPVELPEPFTGDRVTVLPTGPVTIAAKRNAAMRAFPRCGYYAFIDSDAYPDPRWLANGVAAFRDGGRWAVGGPNISPPHECLREKAVGNALRSVLVSGSHAFLKSASGSRYCSSLHSCNLIVPADRLQGLGGFDETLLTGEDQELCHRIIASGGKIYFSDDVVVYHHNRALGRHFFGQRVVHGYSVYAILRRTRGLRSLALLVPLLASSAVAAGLLGGMRSPLALASAAVLVASYLAKVAYDATVHAERPGEIAPTAAAILLANCGYVAGNLLGLFGIPIGFRKLYDNYAPPTGRRAGRAGAPADRT